MTHSRFRLPFLAAALVATLFAAPAAAQTDSPDAQAEVIEGDIYCEAFKIIQDENGNEATKARQVIYARCNTYDIAKQRVNKLQELQQILIGGAAESVRKKAENEFKQCMDNWFGKGRRTTSTRKGVFTVHNTAPGQGVIVMDAEDDEYYAAVLAMPVTEAKQYAAKLRDATEKGNITGKVHAIKGVTATGTQEVGDGGTKRAPRAKGEITSMFIDYNIKPEWWSDYARAVFQSQVIDCETGDVMAYLPPVVYEGPKYHTLQTRRKDYDFVKKDTLSMGYKSDLALAPGAKTYHVFAEQEYRKPNPKRLYDNYVYMWIEDRNKVYRTDTIAVVCMEENFSRLLNYSVSGADMPLYDEFYETALEQAHNVPRMLNLLFKVNTAQFTADEQNQRIMSELAVELKSYGELISRITITGASSPEGGYDKNLGLARDRAAAAESRLRAMLRGSNVNCVYSKREPKVHEWKEVADTLAKYGKTEFAEMVSNIVANTEQKLVFGKLKALPFFDTDIDPVLQSMRAITCEYQYVVRRKWTNREAVEDFYQHKQDYASGKVQIPYEDGDLYGIYQILTADEERNAEDLDLITRLAYAKLTARASYPHSSIIAPYVANRKAIADLRAGVADTLTLAPFIDFKSVVERKDRDGSGLTVTTNHYEIFINQAITYMMLQSTTMADSLARRVIYAPVDNQYKERAEALNVGKEKAKKISMCLDFIELEGIAPANLNNDEERQKQKAARALMFNSDENRAVMYTVTPSFYRTTTAAADSLLNLLDDNNPKKWYLKAILWGRVAAQQAEEAKKNGADEELTEEERAEILSGQAAGVVEKTVPDYLAYLHHCITMEPKYIELYRTEGYITEAVRTKFPYKKKDVPAYEARFRALAAKARHDAPATEAPADEAPADAQQQPANE